MDRFKKGDKVVLIDDDDLDIKCVELYGQYIVESYVGVESINLMTPLIILKNVSAALSGERFISLTKFRKQKIEKLLSKYGY